MQNDEILCVDDCPTEKPLLIDETNECVSSCTGTDSPVFYKYKCYKDDKVITGTTKITNINDETEPDGYSGFKLKDKYGDYAESILYCNGIWFEDKDNNKDSCNTNTETNDCSVFNEYGSFKYLVLPTRECVEKCPTDYPFYFNDNCFESCTTGNTLKEFTEGFTIMEKTDSKECVCENYWKYNAQLKKECIQKGNNDKCPNDPEKPEDNYLLIGDTNECFKGKECREGYLLFNNKCYRPGDCPGNSVNSTDYPNKCVCPNLWYIDANTNDIECLDPQLIVCPNGDYPNLIVSLKKCVPNGDGGLTNKYKFNNEYYDSGCPPKTYDAEGNKNCVCNPLYLWHKIDSNTLECGLENLPDGKPFINEKTKECFDECPNKSYNGICYDDCPELTQASADDPNLCVLKTQIPTANSNLEDITEMISENIVDLYKNSNPEEETSGVIEVEGGNSIVEFYGVNKNSKKESKSKGHNDKEKITSTLSYIDLSECIQSIYENNNMLPTDDIIILKFDMIKTPNEYLINPVEYKFINSRTGENLDASACGNKKIKISYPFFNILKNYDKNIKNKKRTIRILETVMLDLKTNDLNTLGDKYNIGKEINSKYPNIDTFNSKNEIYTDICTTIEINGKDLVLEDRINYLFPHYSLCEQNCTYNHTDFEEERVYCDCSLKTEFDVNRKHENNVDINENSITLSQDGKSNFPVLKCLYVWKDSNRIINNIALYYFLIVIIIEVCFLILIIINGIKNMQNYFSNKVCNLNIGDENIEINNDGKVKINDYIKTTERILSHPPKRENSENDNNGIEFIPEEFIFIYFNDKDKGVKKQVERSLLPFDINKNTKILLQKIEGVDYSNMNKNGPFNEEQNIIEIIGDEEEKNKDELKLESINESLFNETNNNNNIDIKEKKDTNEKELITIEEKDKDKEKESNGKEEEKIYIRKSLKNYIINNNDEIEEDKENKSSNLPFLEKIKIEQRLLRKEYEINESKENTGLINGILVEILDKIHITKIVLFMQKYDILFLNLSIYVLYHVFLLNLLAMFFDIKTIQNIWNKENYPGFGLYLGYGLAACLVCWVIYILFTCILTNKGKYNEIINIKKSKKKKNKMKLIQKKYNSLMSKTKIKIIVYSIIQFLIIILFFIYLVTLCAVYHGTMNKIFASYGIALLEIIIIKILYGMVMAILRQYSLSNQKKGLYNIILFMDNYIV